MATDWSESITIAELQDEPALSEELTALISRAGHPEAPHMVLNFSAVTYLNSSNIAQLLKLRRSLSERGRRLKLCSINDQVWSVMLITGLDKVFRFAPDPMTALASLQIEDAGGEA
jgi:anti-anti-sigma factor